MNDLKWKVLHSEYIHKSPWATLRTEKCELPDGRIMDDYYILEYPNWVTGLAITEEGNVLMVRQYRHAAGIVALEVPGGVIDGDEAPIDAIQRELLEETGYLFTDIEQTAIVYPNPATATNITFCFLAKGGKKVQEQKLDEHEDIIVEQYTIHQIKQLLAENKIPQALHCSCLFYGLSKLGVL